MANEVRLIDLNRTCYELERFYNGYTGELRRVASEALDLVCMMPEVNPESLRPKGRWKLNKDGSGTCSECHRTRNDVWDMDNWDNFCSHCGADMRGE